MHDAKHDETITEISKLEAPYGKDIVLQDVAYENGMRVLRMRIREGHRFTILDFDNNIATQLSDVLANWSAEANQ